MDVYEAARLLESSDPREQTAGAEYLSQNAESASGVAAALVRHVGDANRVVAEYCVATLEELGPPTLAQLPEIALLAESPSTDVAYWGATLLGRTGPAAAPYAELLVGIVAGRTETPLRERAAWAIAKIGPAAAGVSQRLSGLAQCQPSSLVRAIATAQAAIRP